MKIVARVDREKFFCEITLTELNAILSRDEYTPMPYDMQVGETIDLAELIKAARWIKGLDAKHLNEVLKGVERVKRSVEKLNLMNTLTTEHKPSKLDVIDDTDDNIPF
jgi:hypothetical protein